MSAVSVTYFDSPFLFFYYDVSKYESLIKNVLILQNKLKSYVKQNDLYQFRSYMEYQAGEYVAVNHEGSWLRGIMDHHQKVWLIDYGKRIDVYVGKEICQLPEPFKEMPSMIARGSLQYIVPLQKHISNDYMKMMDLKCDHWIDATRAYCEDIFSKASEVIFQVNEVMMIEDALVNVGEILIELDYGETLKVSDEVCRRKWGLRDAEYYLKHLNIFYTPVPTLAFALTDYIVKPPECDSESSWDDDSSVTSASTLIKVKQNQTLVQTRAKDPVDFRESSCRQVVNVSKKQDGLYLTKEESIKMQNKFVVINGRKFDVVKVLNNKIADFNMAFKYANFDEISIGRACKGKHRVSVRGVKNPTSEVGVFRNSIKFLSAQKY